MNEKEVEPKDHSIKKVSVLMSPANLNILLDDKARMILEHAVQKGEVHHLINLHQERNIPERGSFIPTASNARMGRNKLGTWKSKQRQQQ